MSRIRSFAAVVSTIGAIVVALRVAAHVTATEPKPQSAQQQQAIPGRHPASIATAEQVLEWRKKFPFRSLADRLSYEAARAPKTSPPLKPEVERMLSSNDNSTSKMRGESLRLLHEESVDDFVAQSGFGMSRMTFPLRSPHYFETPEVKPIPLAKMPDRSADGPQVFLPNSPAAAAATGGATRLMPTSTEMESMHQIGAKLFASFLNGYAKSVDQVAGFEPHAFRYELTPPYDLAQPAPGPDDKRGPKKWKLVRLELTSLLKHDTPRVYVSENLPRMEDLSSTKTRELTKFETDSLAKLRGGEELVVEATANRIEMFGALRAGKDCRRCHEVPLGTLLGAFSYDLRRDPPIKDAPKAGAVQ